MKKKIKVDFDNMKFLDEEERELYEAIERGEIDAKPATEAEKKKWQKIAAYSIEQRKKQALSLRLGKGDIQRAKAEAARQGLPYQTLIASVVHRYFTGQLKAE